MITTNRSAAASARALPFLRVSASARAHLRQDSSRQISPTLRVSQAAGLVKTPYDVTLGVVPLCGSSPRRFSAVHTEFQVQDTGMFLSNVLLP